MLHMLQGLCPILLAPLTPFAVLFAPHGKFMLGVSSQDRMARLQAWRTAASCGFLAPFCSLAHIADLQTCVKFTRAVNVTYCERWKCLFCQI